MYNLLWIISNVLQHFHNWPKQYPLCVHAERHTTGHAILLAILYNRPVHVCHVARKEEIMLVRAAKEKVESVFFFC